MSLYVAYGSNLNVQQMSYRCPGATVAFTGYLINWKLLYRGSRTGSYATVKRQKGSRVPVAVWNIDSKNEKALDLYEGYPRFYKKRNVFVQLKNGTRKKAMIYLLPDSATIGKPSNHYIETVLQGYKDMGFDISYVSQIIKLFPFQVRLISKNFQVSNSWIFKLSQHVILYFSYTQSSENSSL